MRRRALAILAQVDRGRFASEVLESRDKAFVRELVYGVLRRRLTLDTVQDAFGRRAAADLDPAVRQVLRLGIYQLLFLDGIPPHAAVSETVSLARGGARGYVNAVLRGLLRGCRKVAPADDRGGASPTKRLERSGRCVFFFSRQVFPDPERDKVGYLARLHSHPDFLVERWSTQVDEADLVQRLLADNEPAPVILRPRAGRATAESLVDALAREERRVSILEREGGGSAVWVEKGAEGLVDGRAFRAGLFSVQAMAQMDAAEILAPQPGETIWDACAAPGGKATQMAEMLGADGCIVATDVDAERMNRVHQNIERLGLQSLETHVHDALSSQPPPGRPERGFDAILLDAPCSNTAVLAARPEARWRLRPETFAGMAERQRALIEAVRPHLAPGGRLIFSSCSREPEEGAEHGLAATRSPFVWAGTSDATASQGQAD